MRQKVGLTCDPTRPAKIALNLTRDPARPDPIRGWTRSVSISAAGTSAKAKLFARWRHHVSFASGSLIPPLTQW